MGQLPHTWQDRCGGRAIRNDQIAPDDTPRLAAIVLAVVVLVGLLLRTIEIGREPLWADESLTAILVRYPWWSFPLTSVEATPPLYYWLQKALVPDGAGPVAWRLLSLGAGMATIPLTYWLGRELWSRRAGLVAAGLVAMSAPLVDYSQEARAYALAVAMIVGSAAALAALTGGRLASEPKQRARRRMLAIFAVLTLFAAYSHFIAIFWVFPSLYFLRLASSGARRTIEPREMVWTILAMLPFLALELRREHVFRSEQNSFAWLTQLSPGEVARILGEQWLPFAAWGGALAALVGLIVVVALLWSVRRPLGHWVRLKPLQPLIVITLLMSPIGLWLFGMVFAPVAMARTFLPASVGFAALVGIAIAAIERPVGKVVAVTGVGLALCSTLLVGTTRHKEQWVGAAAATEGAPLVITCTSWKTPSYLAVAKGVGWVVTSLGNRAMIVRRPGDTASWDQLYFERIQQVGHYPMERSAPLRIEQRPITARQAMFVASDCSKIERDALAKWAGVRSATFVWASPRTKDAADIRVERWDLVGDAPLKPWIVR
jgi:4-amino-4-deoxy-L-arabinose transferase-like glycosyltransferase